MENKVCHITNVHKWNDTRIFFKECVSLAESGYDVSLVAPNAVQGIVDGVKIINVPIKRHGRIYRATFLAFFVFLKALRTKARVVHFHDPELIWVGFLLRCFRRTIVFDVHENVIAQIEDKKWMKFKWLFKFIYTIMQFIASKLFYIVIAESSYDVLFRSRTNRITPVLNFPEIKKLKGLKTKSGGNGILYVGVITEGRAILEILQALKVLKDRNVDFIFHCVGSMSDDVRNKIQDTEVYTELKSNILFYGELPVFEAYKLADECALGISILHPLPNYVRSYSTKIFEYMAIGLPFVVSNFELYSFVQNKKIGICVDPKNVLQIAQAFEDILNKNIDVDAMVDRATIEVDKEYSWDSQKANLLELYSKFNLGK